MSKYQFKEVLESLDFDTDESRHAAIESQMKRAASEAVRQRKPAIIQVTDPDGAVRKVFLLPDTLVDQVPPDKLALAQTMSNQGRTVYVWNADVYSWERPQRFGASKWVR